MHRSYYLRTVLVLVAALTLSFTAEAGLPRGAELSADEQDADPATGVTTARGNAEIRIDAYRILGRADRIDVDPGRNEIQFVGHALITVGEERYESERVTCSLDFEKCAAVTPGAAAPTEASAQTLPTPAASSAAVINP